MHRLINKNKLYFYIFSFLFLSTIINNNFLNIFKKKFLISNIQIETNFHEIEKKIFKHTKHLINQNIFFINKRDTINKLNNLKYLEKFEIKKKFPSTIIIKAVKTNLIGLSYINEKKYYIGSNGQFILEKKLSTNKKLPIIFGNFKVKNYLDLLSILENQNINSGLITKFYFHKNKRWDLYFENNIIIRLPNNNIEEAVKIFKIFQKKNKLRSNMIIDLRISKRIVIENGQL